MQRCDATPAEQAFASVPAWERWTCVVLQAVAVVAVLRHRRIAPFAYSVLVTTSVMGGSMELDTALWLTTGLAFAYWPIAARLQHRPEVAGDRPLSSRAAIRSGASITSAGGW